MHGLAAGGAPRGLRKGRRLRQAMPRPRRPAGPRGRTRARSARRDRGAAVCPTSCPDPLPPVRHYPTPVTGGCLRWQSQRGTPGFGAGSGIRTEDQHNRAISRAVVSASGEIRLPVRRSSGCIGFPADRRNAHPDPEHRGLPVLRPAGSPRWRPAPPGVPSDRPAARSPAAPAACPLVRASCARAAS